MFRYKKKGLSFFLEKIHSKPSNKQYWFEKKDMSSFHHRFRAPRDPVAHHSHRTIAALVARCLVPSLWPSGQPCDASPSEAAGFHVVFCWDVLVLMENLDDFTKIWVSGPPMFLLNLLIWAVVFGENSKLSEIRRY